MMDRPLIHFTKMHGVGNDFVLIDARSMGLVDWSGVARDICDRHYGVGADGLLVIDSSRLADVMMRMYNPDGTPDACGNGLRCVARYLSDRSPSHPLEMAIATFAGVRKAVAHGETVTVDMGAPHFRAEEIPMLTAGARVVDYPLEVGGETVRITALSTGTTHSVLFVDSLPNDERFYALSPLIEHHTVFPDRTSVMWCRVVTPNRLELRIWERGAGETWGCGTGACAAAVAAGIHAYTTGPVAVASRGGELQIEWSEGGTIRMTGPAEYVYEGSFPLDS